MNITKETNSVANYYPEKYIKQITVYPVLDIEILFFHCL